jgi:hypothetical protein
VTEKEARKKKLNNLKEALKAKKDIAVEKAVPLLRCWQGANALGQTCE